MNENFYKLLLSIGLPVALQNLISTSVNLMDSLMVGRLGENALTFFDVVPPIHPLLLLMEYSALPS